MRRKLQIEAGSTMAHDGWGSPIAIRTDLRQCVLVGPGMSAELPVIFVKNVYDKHHFAIDYRLLKLLKPQIDEIIAHGEAIDAKLAKPAKGSENRR